MVVVVCVVVSHDGWTPSVAGCDMATSPQAGLLEEAVRCARLSSRRQSKEAALRSAQAYILAGQAHYPKAREIIIPFEGTDDPQVLFKLGWLDARLDEDSKRVLDEFQRAFVASSRLADPSVLARGTSFYAYELYLAARYRAAIQISDALLRRQAFLLDRDDERRTLLRLARALDYIGDPPAAESQLGRLKNLLGDAPLSASELLLDADLHVEADQWRSADELLKQAERAAHREKNGQQEAAAVMNQIQIAAHESDWKRVHELSERVESFGDALTPKDRGMLAFLKGVAARGEGRLEEARKLLEQALPSSPLNTRWQIENELGLTLWDLGELTAARHAFEEAITQLESQGNQRDGQSLESASTGRRRQPYDNVFELLAEAGDADGALATLQRSLASRLDDEVAEASNSSSHDVDAALNRSAAAEKLHEASRELPERQDEPGKNARFVAFVTTGKHSWALVHSPEGSQLVSVHLAPQVFCESMQKFGQDFDEEAGRHLGEEMFPPSTLAKLGSRFAVILPACAQSFSVAALPVGKGRLVDRAVVSIAPDVSTVGFSHAGQAADKKLVLADPLEDLPSARTEAEWTGQATGAEVRVGTSASQAGLENSGAQLLHFATHTVVDVAGPALVLADGNITVTDILRRRPHADLVVLASCHSGSRLQTTAAETLSTAFLRAGSGAVLATLRSVEDAFAFSVVRAFYAQGGLEDPAGALAKVQRELERTEAVARWSAFFVAGSPQSLKPLVAHARAKRLAAPLHARAEATNE